MNSSNEPARSNEKYWQINFHAFLWHATFFALASNFMDVNTVIPSLLIKAGGTSLQLGFLTAIMLGGSSLFQLVFAGFLSRKSRKKKYLLWGINLRVLSLFCLAFVFFNSVQMSAGAIIVLIFVLIAVFALSGAFANVSYVDILGKSVLPQKRKSFFSLKQVIGSIGVLTSAAIVREILKHYGYPFNYAIIFLVAAFLLLIASGGFWHIHEAQSAAAPGKSFIRLLASIPGEIKANKNLKYYLLIINSLGLALGLLPFTILFAKVQFGLGYEMIGNFLLLRTIGMLTTGLILYRFSGKFNYKSLLIFSLISASLIPLSCILFRHHQAAYQMIFILAGVFAASYRMAINGLLLEISSNENRVYYAGISGAGYILTAIFSTLAGLMIPIIGFQVLFIVVMILVLASYIFIRGLHCGSNANTSRQTQ